MANNKVVFGNRTIMDISDTTATESDVASGEVFYKRDGTRGVGTGNYMDKVSNPIANDILVTNSTGQAVDSGVDIDDVALKTELPKKATDSELGLLKTNPLENISLDNDGKLVVGGRLGQFPTSTGIYSSNDREPRNVGDSSFLITDAKGMSLNTNRAFALVSGYGMTCKSANAGATEYRVSNTYANRIICKMAEGGFASRDEATSKAEQIVAITSVTINGSSFTPSSVADSSTDIVIKTSETLNPNSAITSIRLFGIMGSYSSVYTGNGIKGESGGRNLLIGGGVTKASSSNDNCLVGNGIYSSGNGNACFGRYHIARKNRGFLAGTGHDTTNATNEGASAVGQYSFMDSNTLFAVGNGTSHTARSNAFEVRNDGVVLKSPNGTRYKLSVDDSGNLTTTAL